MAMTPVEVRHLQLRRGLFGYKRDGVSTALDEIAESFESVWRERADLAQRLEDLEAELARHHELENLLRSTLVSAERAAQDLKEQARREADVIVNEANAESRRILRDAIAEKERLGTDVRRIHAMLRTALEVVEDSGQTETPAAAPGQAAAKAVDTPQPKETTPPTSSDDSGETGVIRGVAG